MENPRTACELVHGRLHTRFFNNRAVGSQASVQYRDSSLLIFRPAHRVNHIVFNQRGTAQIFCYRFSRHGHVSRLQPALNRL